MEHKAKSTPLTLHQGGAAQGQGHNQVMLAIPQTEKIKRDTCEIIAFAADGVSVVTHEEHLRVSERLQTIIRAKKQIVALFKKAKDDAFAAHRSICGIEKKLLEPLEMVELECNRKVKAYLVARDERERREADRIRREAEAEAARKTAEAKRAQDDERLKIAQQLTDVGFTKEAEEVLSQDLPAPIIVPIIPKQQATAETVSGQHLRTTYRFVIDDLMMIAMEVIAGRQPLSAILPNQKYFDKMANAAKGELRIPGGHVEKDSTLVNRDMSLGEI